MKDKPRDAERMIVHQAALCSTATFSHGEMAHMGSSMFSSFGLASCNTQTCITV